MTRARIATSEATSNETKLVPSPSTHSVSEPEGLPEYRKSAIKCSHRGESGTNPDQGKLGFLSTMSKVQPCHKKRTGKGSWFDFFGSKLDSVHCIEHLAISIRLREGVDCRSHRPNNTLDPAPEPQ